MLRYTLAAILGVFFASSAAAQPPTPQAGVSRYACPMKCEGEKRYEAAGKCPVCRMALKPVAAPGYSLTLASPGGPPKGNETTVFNLSVVDSTGASVKAFDPVDGKRLHLYIVLNDLAWFTHLTPDQNDSGGFRFETTLPPGEYTAYADFTPAGAKAEVATAGLSVSGKAANPRALGADADRPRTVDGCTVTVSGYQSAVAGMDCEFTFHVSVDGKDADRLEPYLGKPGHVIVMSQDRERFVRTAIVPGATRGADVSVAAKFPEPGLYRAWFQFQRGGKVSTVAFNFNVEPADKK